MRRSIFMTVLAVAALASCNRIDTPEMGNNALDISVRNGMGTKAVIEGTTLPDGSEIGLFVTDQTGSTYDGNTIANMKYTATGEGDAQKWNAASDVLLSATVANIGSYYPYDESVTDLTAIPIEATSEIQKDWMWGTPVSGLDNKNTSATITMNHALAAVRLNIKKNNYPAAGKITYVSFTSYGAGTSAIMNTTDGALTNIKGARYVFESTKEFTLDNDATPVNFIAVPTNTAAPLIINMIVDGKLMRVQTADVTLQAGNIYECNLSINMSTLSLSKLNVTKWTTEQMGDVKLLPYCPVVKISGTSTNIRTEQNYKDKILTVKAYSTLEGYKVEEVSVTGGFITQQSVDEEGVRTIVISNASSTVTIKFNGSTYVPWARIQHVDGTLYTAEEWTAAEEAGTVTDADANGVAVRYSSIASCPHVIYPTMPTSRTWSNLGNIEISGVMKTSTNSTARTDVYGLANTSVILAAVTDGIIQDASAVQFCTNLTFANGQQGYLPAAGELYAQLSNRNVINDCLSAIGGEIIPVSSTSYVWSSTQYSESQAWAYYNDQLTKLSKTANARVRPACAFSY